MSVRDSLARRTRRPATAPVVVPAGSGGRPRRTARPRAPCGSSRPASPSRPPVAPTADPSWLDRDRRGRRRRTRPVDGRAVRSAGVRAADRCRDPGRRAPWLAGRGRPRPAAPGRDRTGRRRRGRAGRSRLERARTGGRVPGVGRTGRDGGLRCRDRRGTLRRSRRDRPVRAAAAPRRAGGRAPRASVFVPAPVLATAGRRGGGRGPAAGPVLLIPNPQDAVIAQQQQVREAAERQAEAIERVAEDLENKGADANDPRTRLAQELRDLAQQLRQRPTTSTSTSPASARSRPSLRAQIDPANEQRAASLTSLSRALSSAATGKPDANRDGDPEKARDDLKDLGGQARRADAGATEGPRQAAGRDGSHGLAGRRSGRHGLERGGPEPGPGRHGGSEVGARPAR